MTGTEGNERGNDFFFVDGSVSGTPPDALIQRGQEKELHDFIIHREGADEPDRRSATQEPLIGRTAKPFKVAEPGEDEFDLTSFLSEMVVGHTVGEMAVYQSGEVAGQQRKEETSDEPRVEFPVPDNYSRVFVAGKDGTEVFTPSPCDQQEEEYVMSEDDFCRRQMAQQRQRDTRNRQASEELLGLYEQRREEEAAQAAERNARAARATPSSPNPAPASETAQERKRKRNPQPSGPCCIFVSEPPKKKNRKEYRL